MESITLQYASTFNLIALIYITDFTTCDTKGNSSGEAQQGAGEAQQGVGASAPSNKYEYMLVEDIDAPPPPQ